MKSGLKPIQQLISATYLRVLLFRNNSLDKTNRSVNLSPSRQQSKVTVYHYSRGSQLVRRFEITRVSQTYIHSPPLPVL